MTKTEFSLQLVSQRYRDYLIADLQLTNSVIRALRRRGQRCAHRHLYNAPSPSPPAWSSGCDHNPAT